jgi:hypothetical protein
MLVRGVRICNRGAVTIVLTLFVIESRFIYFQILLSLLLLLGAGFDVVRYATTSSLEHTRTMRALF